ncbi:hypothetical protein [Pseudodesulfovibrio tunisiensis]|uniref:Bbp19 family protein n=1 Tax=Pseudodesulfovibrio tunisiensis TaxID=463192 RepID=UPI001FB3992A|nr:hypothetical protein [Pseudodesulfovibrio tunisiensis]
MRDPLELHRAYQRTFATPDGRAVLHDLEERGYFLRSTYSPEPGRIEFGEGRRSMVLHIRHMTDESNFINIKENDQ